ncbi:MAG: hypothetical protein ACOYI9_12795 [Candidatus Hydrogenedentales bacterium]|jgi:hypothetical protein
MKKKTLFGVVTCLSIILTVYVALYREPRQNVNNPYQNMEMEKETLNQITVGACEKIRVQPRATACARPQIYECNANDKAQCTGGKFEDACPTENQDVEVCGDGGTSGSFSNNPCDNVFDVGKCVWVPIEGEDGEVEYHCTKGEGTSRNCGGKDKFKSGLC